MKDYFMNETGFQSYLFFFENNDVHIMRYNRYSFVYVESGVCNMEFSDKRLTAYPGQIIFIPEETSVKLSFDNEKKLCCTGQILHVRFFAGVNKYDYLPQIFKPTKKMVEILKEIPVGNNNKHIEINCKYLADVYTFLSISIKLLTKNSVKQILIIEKALDYMQNNLGCAVDDIVKECNISRCYLFKIFKEKLGTTPIKIKQKLQAERGEKLLITTNLSIEEIANEVGLESVAHFRNVFYSRFFTSPGKYRKNHKNDANA